MTRWPALNPEQQHERFARGEVYMPDWSRNSLPGR
jgi:hypothetical protein